MWLTLEKFEAALPELRKRGFPPADPTTGNYDLDAIDAWRRGRHPTLFSDQPTLPPAATARKASDVVRERLKHSQ